MIKVFLGVMLVFLGLPFQSFASEYEASSVKKIEIKNPKGEVVVTGVKGAKKIAVSFEKVQFNPKCRFQEAQASDLLSLTVTQESALFEKANCVGKIHITVPQNLPEVEVSTSIGFIKFAGVDSAIDFKTATGMVEIEGGALKSVTGKTATGKISVRYQSCPKRADIDLVTATGDADIALGTGCKIRVNHKSATGELFNELGDSEDFQVLVSMKSASGNLKVKKLLK